MWHGTGIHWGAHSFQIMTEPCSRKQPQLLPKVDVRGGFGPVFSSSKLSTALSACQKFLCQSVNTLPSEDHLLRGRPHWGNTTVRSIYGFIHPSFSGAVHVVVAVMINIIPTWRCVDRDWMVNSRVVLFPWALGLFFSVAFYFPDLKIVTVCLSLSCVNMTVK